MLKLHFQNKQLNDVWLVEPKLQIGSSAKSDLWLQGVALQYAEILIDHETLSLQCLEENCAYVNGNKVDGNSPVLLVAGDQLKLGTHELVVIDPKHQTSAKPKLKPQAKNISSGWALKSRSSALASRVFSLSSITTIGRSKDCDISLATAHLSRRHAELKLIESVLYVKDLESSNGTFLNGKPVRESRLKHGDDLRFDTLSFEVIGPTDDLDQTTVRPVIETASKTKRSIKHKPQKSEQASAISLQSPSSSADKTVNAAVKEKSGNAWLAVSLLFIIAVGGYLAQQQGFF